MEEENGADEGEGQDEHNEGINSQARRIVRVKFQHGV